MKHIKYLILFALIIAATLTTFMSPINLNKKDYHFLLCMSSFKRPIFASGQIFRLMNQTYPHFDISVSMKGVNESWNRITFEKEWQKLKEDKRLFVRYDPNRGQLHNLLDTVRNINLDKYDYFCKIDDDDWYAPTYLESINNQLNRQNNVAISHATNAYVLTEDISSTYFNLNNSGLSGPTMCFSREMIRIALEVEKNPKLLYVYLPEEANSELFTSHEDRLLHHLARNLGTEQLRYDTEPQVIFGQQYRSVIRNDNYVKY